MSGVAEFISRLKTVAESSGVGAVPQRVETIPRLSERTLKVLGWTREDEIFNNMDVRVALAAIRDPDDYIQLSKALEAGSIAEIGLVAEDIAGMRAMRAWSRAPAAGFFGLVSDYLDTFRHQPVAPLSPRTEGGIY